MHPHHHFAALLVAVAAGLVAYVLARRFRPSRPVRAPDAPLEGFAGWLRFLAALQWLAVLHVFGNLVSHMPYYRQHLGTSAADIGAIAALVVQVLLLAVVLCSAILMTRKSRLFPVLFRVELVLLVLMPLVVAALMTWVTKATMLRPEVALVYWVQVAIFAPAAGAGFVYSLRSVRFRNTFVKQERLND